MPRVNVVVKTCVLCNRERPINADGRALGHEGPLCHSCYQKEWRRQRRPGPFQSDAREVARLSAEVERLRGLAFRVAALKPPLGLVDLVGLIVEARTILEEGNGS